MKRHIKKGIAFVAGWFFVVVGLVGIFMPFLQGILLILVGFYILSFVHKGVDEKIEKFVRRFPRVAKAHHTLKEKLDNHKNR